MGTMPEESKEHHMPEIDLGLNLKLDFSKSTLGLLFAREMATFVLIHRSCHGGWCWKKVTPLLTKDGHEGNTPTLTGLGKRSHLVSRDIELDTNILDIIQVLEYENLNKVTLVAHSYGGLVIGGVAEKVPERIIRLV
jgi:pimeloyl-ACP methyl ester carboxylesterase